MKLFSTFLGNFDNFLEVLLVLIVIDYVSAILSAIHNKKISSSIGYKGIIKKFGIIFFVSLSQQIDKLNIYEDNNIRYLVLSFFIINEILSILENLKSLNLPIPDVFKDKRK